MAPWTVVIPVKALPTAKSRLAGDVEAPGDLALAFLRDTLAAVVATPDVQLVVVVTSDTQVAAVARELSAEVVDDTGHPGINPAARHGAATAPAGSAIAVVVSDLPCLTPHALTTALGAAARYPRAFLADLDDTGTTMWFCGPGEPVESRFGAGSRAAHVAAGDVDIVRAHPESATALIPARLDIDTAAALDRAVVEGLGPATAALLHPVAAPPA